MWHWYSHSRVQSDVTELTWSSFWRTDQRSVCARSHVFADAVRRCFL